jgi:hypothetical protein
MDVHKNIIVATIGITNKKTRITEYIQETFSTLNPDLLNLKQWLINHKCFDACMESTGKYWIPIFNILEDEINIYLTHPKYVKAIKGKKTDKKDSKWICDLFKHDLIKFSFIPPKEIRALREISRYRHKLVGMRSSERNRYQNCMTVSNIGIGSVFSDPFGRNNGAKFPAFHYNLLFFHFCQSERSRRQRKIKGFPLQSGAQFRCNFTIFPKFKI